MKDVLIIFDNSDQPWADWIAWQVQKHGYTVMLHQLDSHCGGASPLESWRVDGLPRHRMLVISPAFFAAVAGRVDWITPVDETSTGQAGKCMAVQVKPDGRSGRMDVTEAIDLVDLDEDDASRRLIGWIGDIDPSVIALNRSASHTAASETEPHPAYPGGLPGIWNLRACRNPCFTGREAVLSNLRKTFLAACTGLPVQAIKGMGGTGKSQIALEYAYRHAGEYRAVWWVRSGNEDDLLADYSAFASALGLIKRHSGDHRLLLQTVRAWLSENSNWLLIFDNVIRPDDLREYLPARSTGHILITSRHQTWERICPSSAVAGWPKDESLAFLFKRTGDNDRSAASGLADALQGLPLAIEQAAAYMRANTIGCAEYLTVYQNRQRALWGEKPLPLHYPATLGTTLSLAVEKIQTTTPIGNLVLSLCAYVSAGDVPRRMVDAAVAYMPEDRSGVFADPSAVDEAVRLLHRYALVAARLDHLAMHRLVQNALKDRLSDAQRRLWSKIALLSAADMLPRDVADHRQSTGGAMRHAHVRTAAMHARDNGVDPEIVAGALRRLASDFQACGFSRAAGKYYRNALKIQEKQVDGDHFNAAMITGDLAGSLHSQQRYDQAGRVYRRALEIVETHFGPDHPDFIVSLNNLNELMRDQGSSQDARDLSLPFSGG